MKPLIVAAISIVTALTACQEVETVGKYGGFGKTWVLTELDNIPFTARATLTFPEPGKIAGRAPCNRYFGTMTTPYPWFKAETIGATRMACSDLKSETLFLKTLGEMTLSEVSGNTLILSNDRGQIMVFKAQKTDE